MQNTLKAKMKWPRCSNKINNIMADQNDNEEEPIENEIEMEEDEWPKENSGMEENKESEQMDENKEEEDDEPDFIDNSGQFWKFACRIKNRQHLEKWCRQNGELLAGNEGKRTRRFDCSAENCQFQATFLKNVSIIYSRNEHNHEMNANIVAKNVDVEKMESSSAKAEHLLKAEIWSNYCQKTQQLLTFKKFLATQDETMTDEQAIKKYKEYKIEFIKQECERYFQAHKEEEWFRHKYHPENGKQRTKENRQNLQKRFEIFNEFLSTGRFDGFALSYENAERIIRIFDEVVIKLEGCTNADIQAVNKKEIEDESLLNLLSPEQLKKKEAEKKSRESASKGNLNGAKNDTKIARNTEEDMEATNADEEAAQNNNQDAEMKRSIKRNQPHKTRSIYFRTVPADATLDILENLCQQHPGFLRLAFTDPSPNSKGKLMRSAWATFRWDVNINDIFWSLRNAKFNGTELGGSIKINREFICRVRTIGATRGLISHRPIVQNDIGN